jgi:hypothetical protein
MVCKRLAMIGRSRIYVNCSLKLPSSLFTWHLPQFAPPLPLLNEIILGALARAKSRYGVELSAFIFLSNHILVWATYSEQLASYFPTHELKL